MFQLMIEEFGEDAFNRRKVSMSEALKRVTDLMYVGTDSDDDDEDHDSVKQTLPSRVPAKPVK